MSALPLASDGRLYLGLAAFLHYAKESGFEFSTSGQDRLLLDKGEYVLFEKYEDRSRTGCGCIYTSVPDLFRAFSENPGLIQVLIAKCQKKFPWGTPEALKDPHCRIDESLWGKLSTPINKGKMVIKCIQIPIDNNI